MHAVAQENAAVRSLVSDAARSTRRSIPTCPAVCAVHCSSGIERRAAAPHAPKPRLAMPPARLYAHVASTPPPVTTVRPFTFIASFAIFGSAPQTSDLLALSAALIPKPPVPTLDHLMRTLPGLAPRTPKRFLRTYLVCLATSCCVPPLLFPCPPPFCTRNNIVLQVECRHTQQNCGRPKACPP